jgi:hypothetical protein
MTNSLILPVLALAMLSASCSSTHDDGGSSGSHWLTCDVDGDCTAVASGASCAGDGYCVDDTGARIRVDDDAGAAGGRGGAGGTSGAGMGGTSGTGGSGSGGTGGGGASGSGAGGTGGSVADAGVTLPDCGEQMIGSECSFRRDQPAPQCCDGSLHLLCEPVACTDSIPGNCFGMFDEVADSELCGGYMPCAGKACGDSCDVCDPTDPDCALGDALFTCDPAGVCVVGMAECPVPEMCDLEAANTCGAGRACCAVGRCGPIENGEGVCEPADPDTGGCIRCACETQPGGCPICNSPDTPIATPQGERAIADLREGDLVLSMHRGELTAVPVLAIGQARVIDHAVVRLTLDSGRVIEVSGSHPTADGRRLDALAPGDALGELHVLGVELVPYAHDRTYDILPASDSGTYLAAGVLLGSTLAPPAASD